MRKWLEDFVVARIRVIYHFVVQHGPSWLPLVLKGASWIIFGLFAFFLLIELYNKFRKEVGDLFGFISEAERNRNRLRRRFCERLIDRMQDLNRALQWSDKTFTEMEAEVELEGRRYHRSVLPSLLRSRSGIRRDKSLTHAIAFSREPRVVLEGPAGCGKTVALRHVVLKLARAADSPFNHRPIAIYVNLKTLFRGPGEQINPALIEKHVRRYTNDKGFADFDDFFTRELARGRDEGSLIFLFDSFDEIPEILSATDADERIRAYANAIDGFLGGLAAIRGVVASRPFRGPARLGWPVFRVLPLTADRQARFIRMSNLGEEVETRIIGELPNARLELQMIAENPLVLRLLCEHVRIRGAFPGSAFEVFETFVNNRFLLYQPRIASAFGASVDELRGFAERTAFAMQVERSLGLSPAVDDLIDALVQHAGLLPSRASLLLEALASAGFGTIAPETGVDRFSFGHRRLQEYFATAVVLRDPDRLRPQDILLDGRWRETAVTLLQARPADTLPPLLDCASGLLQQMSANVAGAGESGPVWFPWPGGSLHLLGLLQDGLASRSGVADESIRASASAVLQKAFQIGTLLDQKWVIESAAIATPAIFEGIVAYGLSSVYEVLRDPAYRQAARLVHLPGQLEYFIRVLLLRQALRRDIQRNGAATRTHLRRLPNGGRFVSLARRLAVCADLDFLMCLWPLAAAFTQTVFSTHSFVSLEAAQSFSFGFMGSAVLWISRTPAHPKDADFVSSISKRARWRYPMMAVASGLAIFPVLREWSQDGMALLGVLLLGYVPPLLVWLGITRAVRNLYQAPWITLPSWQTVRRTGPEAVWNVGRQTLAWLLKYLLFCLIIMAGAALFTGVVVGIFAVGTKFSLYMPSTSAFLKTLGKYAFAGFELVIFGFMLYGGGAFCYAVLVFLWHVVCDYYHLARASTVSRFEANEFLDICFSLRRSVNYARLFRFVRRGGKLDPDPEIHRATAAMLIGSQSQFLPPFQDVPGLTDSKRFKIFLSEIRKSPEAISELARLVEQLQPEKPALARQAFN